MGPQVKIILSKPDQRYFPGEEVSGHVQLITKKTIKIKAIKLTAIGFGNKSGKKNLSWEEFYYSTVLQLLNSTTPRDLIVGEHSFPFSYVLPPGVPSSFEATNGYVKHQCKVFVDLHKTLIQDAKAKLFLNVVSKLDLNYSRWLKEPVKKSTEKKVKSMFSKTSKITVTVKLNQTGFAPGDDIIVDAYINNGSNKTLTKAVAEIIQIVEYKIPTQTVRTQYVLSSKMHKYDISEKDTWTNERLSVPPAPPSGLEGCSIIDISYEFKFTVVQKSSSTDLNISIPLTIGSDPFIIIEDIPEARQIPAKSFQPPIVNQGLEPELYVPTIHLQESEFNMQGNSVSFQGPLAGMQGYTILYQGPDVSNPPLLQVPNQFDYSPSAPPSALFGPDGNYYLDSPPPSYEETISDTSMNNSSYIPIPDEQNLKNINKIS